MRGTEPPPGVPQDPPPVFGYTFSDDFFGAGTPSAYDSAGPSLLSDVENQSLADFFSSTDPFQLADSHAFPSTTDAKDGLHDHNNWGDFIAPAQVHRVATTVPNQAHLQHSFHHRPTFSGSLPTSHYENTPDDLQAASTLVQNSQPAYLNGSIRGLEQASTSRRASAANDGLESPHNSRPMVATSHGLIHEQLAALLPNHAEDGTLDAQLAAHWANSHVPLQHAVEFGLIPRKPSFKRSYTFGTDQSFNKPSGYSATPTQICDGSDTRHSIHSIQESENLLRMVTGSERPGTTLNERTQSAQPSDTEHSNDASTSEDDEVERPNKKQRKSKARRANETPRKGTRVSKSRKASLKEESGKKRRSSTAAQRLQRENLTDEQKRNNHILSEQKRRNLIKRGFDDLHHLVPEIRNGGLSKSSVLMEAGNFLEKLIEDNLKFSQLAGGVLKI